MTQNELPLDADDNHLPLDWWLKLDPETFIEMATRELGYPMRTIKSCVDTLSQSESLKAMPLPKLNSATATAEVFLKGISLSNDSLLKTYNIMVAYILERQKGSND